MSLKCMIDKWLHKGQISQEEYDAVIKKLEGHDKQIKADAIEPIQKFIDDYDGAIIISENMGVISGQQLINELKEIVEQLKGAENG